MGRIPYAWISDQHPAEQIRQGTGCYDDHGGEFGKENVGLIRRNWIWILVILGGVAVFAAFRFSRKAEAEYFTAKVEKGDIRQVIEATGTINPVTSVQVGSQVSGMIAKLYVDFNSKVTKGQVIAEIEEGHGD
jgi:multidrug efflux pump subunit AcrA (membrane-fusion protein)